MFETKYVNRRYRQTPQPPNSNYFNQTPQQLSNAPSVTQGLKFKFIKPVKNTQGNDCNYGNTANRKMKLEQLQSQKADKFEIIDFSQKFQKPGQYQQPNKWTYSHWLQRNSLKMGLPRKLIKQKADISLNIKKSIQFSPSNQYSKSNYKTNKLNRNIKNQDLRLPINNIGFNNYNYLFNSVKNSSMPKNKQKFILQNDRKIFQHTDHQKRYLIQYDQVPSLSDFKQLNRQKQSQQTRPLDNKIIIQIKRQPGTYSSFQRNHLAQQNFTTVHKKQQKKNYYPVIISHKNSTNSQYLNYYAQSFKGKRPYNQDRYICQLKSYKNLSNNLVNMGVKILKNNATKEMEQLQKKYNVNNSNWLFGVFDGHGGAKCAQFIKQSIYQTIMTTRSLFNDPAEALKQAFLKLQQKFLSICEKSGNLQSSGSCAVICFIRNKKLYIANVGDSRALLLNNQSYKQLTKDHKPDEKEQKSRIIRYGGKLYKDGSVMGIQGKQNIRIFNQTRIIPGNLNVSRTLGDIEVKIKKYGGLPGIVVADPDVFIQHLNTQQQFVLLASDGLFQGLQNKQIHQIFLDLSKTHSNHKFQHQPFVKIFTKQLIRKASQKSNDNITVVCLKLPVVQPDTL